MKILLKILGWIWVLFAFSVIGIVMQNKLGVTELWIYGIVFYLLGGLNYYLVTEVL